jgi:capsular polysaccharide transport system permease protein
MDQLTRLDTASDPGMGPAEACAKAISVELRRVARKARVPKPVTSGGGGFRARRSEKLFRAVQIGSFCAIFVLPTLLCALYLLLIAANQYTSESRFMIRSGQQSSLESLASLSSLVGGGQGKDGQIIAQYVESRGMIEALSRDFDFKQIFSPGNGDVLAELRSDATIEDVVEYWEGQVAISVDRNSGLVTMKVRTFSPQDSLAISRSVLSISEAMVNKLTRRNEDDALSRAQKEVERSLSELERATGDLRDARNAAGVLDVDVTAKAYGEVTAALRLELSKREQEIASLTRSVDMDTPRVVALKNRVTALSEQIDQYEKSIAGSPVIPTKEGDLSGNSSNLADRALILSQRELDLKIAQTEYAVAASSLEKARLTSSRQQSYLVPYVEPRLAERSLYPKRGLIFTVVLVVSFILWASFVGSATLVRDHMA